MTQVSTCEWVRGVASTWDESGDPICAQCLALPGPEVERLTDIEPSLEDLDEPEDLASIEQSLEDLDEPEDLSLIEQSLKGLDEPEDLSLIELSPVGSEMPPPGPPAPYVDVTTFLAQSKRHRKQRTVR